MLAQINKNPFLSLSAGQNMKNEPKEPDSVQPLGNRHFPAFFFA